MTVYVESLMNGQYVGRAWNGQGQQHFKTQLLPPEVDAPRQAFWVELDGQLLHSHWEYVDFEQTQEEDKLHHVLILKHGVRPVTIRVHTVLDGTPIITRWLEITNTGDQPAALSSAYPWSGCLYTGAGLQYRFLKEGELYSVGYMQGHAHGREGQFDWRPLPNSTYRINGRYRRKRARHPMFVVRNEITGEHFIGQLAWSGGYAFEFDITDGPEDANVSPLLFFRAGPEAPAPMRIIAPEETVATPEMHLGMVQGDLDEAVQAMHDHIRQSVMMPQPRGRGCWVEGGIAGDIFELTPELVNSAIDVSAELGAEVVFIDAGWYGDKDTYWATRVGDWNVGNRLPEGLASFRKRCHEKGMLWGLWMEAERIGHESRMAQDHPEYGSLSYSGERFSPVDLSNPEVARWFEDSINRVIQENELDFFRLDYNCTLGYGGTRLEGGFVENNYWRYYETLYAVFDRIRARYPDLILENCAGGGGRTDFGMIKRFSHTWVTDQQQPPYSFTIGNGMTIALPPELVDRHLIGQGQPTHLAGSIDWQCRLAMFGRPTIGTVLWLVGADPNPVLKERVKRTVKMYKEFVRPFLPTSRIYHHTPTLTHMSDPYGIGVMELVSRDKTKAIAGLFRTAGPENEYLMRFKGLDPAKRYEVTSDRTGTTFVMEGKDLVYTGLPIRLDSALDSELLLCKAVG
jgi:alpha-galactosidase